MTIDEAVAACGICAEKLRRYKELGLLGSETDGDELLRRIGAICSFAKAGVGAEKIAKNPVLLDERAETVGERIMIMRKERCRQLDGLHTKQQELDCLDGIIRKIKNGGRICR